jgi:hypothetical protein
MSFEFRFVYFFCSIKFIDSICWEVGLSLGVAIQINSNSNLHFVNLFMIYYKSSYSNFLVVFAQTGRFIMTSLAKITV